MKKRHPKKKVEKAVLINVENTTYPSVTRNAKRLGWKITESTEKAILFWYDNNVDIELCLTLRPWQFINHIPGTFAISRKIELARNFEKMQKVLPEIYNFHPKSFSTQSQALELHNYMINASLKNRTFIIKPDLGAQGKGIYLIQDPDSATQVGEMAVAQQYIAPHLIDGYKFDLRIYVLVSSIDPLRIYTFKEGMARFCTEPYKKPRPGNLGEIFRHLTNYSLNKKNDKFEQPTDKTGSSEGFKRSYTSVLEEMNADGVDIKKLQNEIDELIILTIVGVQNFLSHSVHTSFRVSDNKSRCFEIMGFDVMIDKNLKPWLLEVNHSPSLQCDSPFDKELKDNVITGAMKIMDLNPRFKKIITNNERERTKQRITGISKQTKNIEFNPERETEISKETGWRLLYPTSDPILEGKIDKALEVQKELSVAGSEETAAVRQRREAIAAKIRKAEEKDSFFIHKKKVESIIQKNEKSTQLPKYQTKTPRSYIMLREAKLQRIRSEQMREAHGQAENDKVTSVTPSVSAVAKNSPHVTRPKISTKNAVFDLP